MVTIRDRRKFFAKRPNTTTARMGGKLLKFINFPREVQLKIKKRIAEKDEVMAQGLKGILPGLKINGIQVTKDNIKSFEIPRMGSMKKVKVVKKEVIDEVPVEEVDESKPTFFSEKALEAMTFKELRAVGDKLELKFRSKAEGIREILEVQE